MDIVAALAILSPISRPLVTFFHACNFPCPAATCAHSHSAISGTVHPLSANFALCMCATCIHVPPVPIQEEHVCRSRTCTERSSLKAGERYQISLNGCVRTLPQGMGNCTHGKTSPKGEI